MSALLHARQGVTALVATLAATMITLTSFAPAAWSAPPAPDWQPGVPDITLAEASPDKRFHFPNAERLDDGAIVVVAREGSGHTGQDGRLVMLRSTDHGATWSEPQIVVDTPVDDRDPMITQTSSGRLLLSWFQIDYSVQPAEVLGTFVARSDDRGKTWSSPVLVNTSLSGESDIVDTYELGWAASHGQIAELADGSLIIPLYGTTPDDRWQRSVVVRSEDGGETWNAFSEALVASQRGTHFQEPVLTVLNDGTVVALLRIGTSASTMGASHSQISRSTDGGRTWTDPKKIDLPTSSAHTEVLRNGDVFLAYGDLSGNFSPRRATVGAVIRHPDRSWIDPAREIVYDSGTGDQANPAAVEVSPGLVLVVGFDSEARTLVGTFVETRTINDRGATADPRRLNLEAMHAAGELEIITDMTYSSANQPATVGPAGAIDGEVGYWSAAWAPKSAPAFYELHFEEPVALRQVGLALKPGFAESAIIEAANTGGEWHRIAEFDHRVRWGGDVTWTSAEQRPGFLDRIRVRIPTADGWAGISEIAIRAVPAN